MQLSEHELTARAASAQIVIGTVIGVGSAIAFGIAIAVAAIPGVIVGGLFVAGAAATAVHGVVRRNKALRALKA